LIPTKTESRSTNGCLEFPDSMLNLTPDVEVWRERRRGRETGGSAILMANFLLVFFFAAY
jgi:hypothetical protein